jgi:predicted TIM-barrel fold metal-dependent hydrolase
MIIDAQSYLWSNLEQLGRELACKLRARAAHRLAIFDAGPAAHEHAMTCVNASMVFGFRSDRLGARIPNELIAEFVSRDAHKRVGVAGIDPLSADSQDQLLSAHDMGLLAAALSPASQGFHPAHSAAMQIYERCASLGMPLFVTAIEPLTPKSILEFGRPALWDEVAQTFPKLPIVISRLGYPWIDETLVMLGKHANVFADISGVASRPWQLYNVLLSATSLGVMDKLLFASGFPFETPAKTIESLYSVNSFAQGTRMPTVPRAQIRSIVERNTFACLGIDAEIPMAESSATADEMAEIVELLEQRGTRGPLGPS